MIPVKKAIYACCPSFLTPVLNRIETSKIGYRLTRGVFWSMAGAVISRGLMLAASVLVARMLSKTGFGELGMMQSTVGMFGVFAGFGLGLTATKHIAEFRQSNPERAGRIISFSWLVAMLTGGLMALGLFIFAPWLAVHTINAPHLAGVLRIGALILFISALNGAQTGALAGFESFKAIAHVNLFVGLLSFPILVCGAYFGGLTGAVWAMVINLCFNWLFNHIALRKEMRRNCVPFTFNKCYSELPVLWSFALPLTLCGIMVGPANWVCRALLTNQPNGYDEMGILTAALVFQAMLFFVSNMLSAPLLSMVSNAGANISDKLGTVNILSTWILGVIFAIPLLCFPEVAQLIFGSDYATRSFQVTFSLVVFCTSIITFKDGGTRLVIVNKLIWWGFLSNSLWAIVLIGSTFFFVRWGAIGIAFSMTVAYVIQTVAMFPIYLHRKILPEKTLVSWRSLIIWSVLVFLLILNIMGVPMFLRGVLFVPCVWIVIRQFIGISNRSHFNQKNGGAVGV